MQQKKEYSYGAIPILSGSETDPLVLILRHTAGHWGLPKGHPEDTETPIETAKRELIEETGITEAELHGRPRFTQHYSFYRENTLHQKTVIYFPAYIHTRSITLQSEEVIEYKWASFDKARDLLVVNGNKNEAIEKFISWWQENK